MEWQMLIKVVIIIFGLAILWGGLIYKKKDHEEFSEGISVTYSDSFIALIVVFIFGFLLGIGPWWLAKIFILLFGVALLYFGIFLL